MSLLYKDRKDIKYSVEVKTHPDSRVDLLFTCDGGKFGTDEILDEFNMTTETLLDALQKHFND